MEKKAVIWVSTVLYILITIAVIGIAFAALKPKIDSMQDKAIIEQSINMMENLDDTILQAAESQGNVRQIQLNIKKGELDLNFGTEDETIAWVFDSSYKYSEENKILDIGKIKLKTVAKPGASNVWTVALTIDYSEIDLKYKGADKKQEITASELPVTLSIENKGEYLDISANA